MSTMDATALVLLIGMLARVARRLRMKARAAHG
jgi:hypothetical protein